MSLKLYPEENIQSIADAIRTKNGSSDTYTVGQMAEAIENIPTGGGGSSASAKDVNFYDYDGTVVQSYTAQEFAALSAMPDNPSHDGLTAQGWNWSLSDAKTYVQNYGKLNIGQMYVTTSGDTEIDIELHYGRLEPYVGICPNGTVEIDWGDGSAKDTVTGTSLTTIKNTKHVYASEGAYTIKLHVDNGNFAIVGYSSYNSRLLWGNKTSGTSYNRSYQNAIQAVKIGNNVTTIGEHAFSNCYSLTSITMPNSVTSIGNSAMYYCYSLKSVIIPSSVTSISNSMLYACYSLVNVSIPNSVTSMNETAFSNCCSLEMVTIPSNVTSIPNSAFYNCYSLTSITIPSSVTSIGTSVFSGCYSLSSITIPNSVTSISSNAFNNCNSLTSITIPSGVTTMANNLFTNCYSLATVTIQGDVTSIDSNIFTNCYSLTSITIPSSVTSISTYVFYNCCSLKYLIFLPTTPPTVSNSSAFSSVASDIVVYVPQGTLATYQEATNYSSIASKMVEI